MNKPGKLQPIVLFTVTVIILAAAVASTGWSSTLVRFVSRELSAIFLLLCILPYILRISNITESYESIRKINTKLLKPAHWAFGTVGFTLAVFHGFREARCSIYMQISLFLYAFFVTTGIALQWKLIPSGNYKRVFRLHKNKILVFVMLGFIILGHILEEL